MSQLTLPAYLAAVQQRLSHVTPELSQLILQVSQACKTISKAIGQGALAGVLGQAGSENVQGEEQKKLDVLSNEWMLAALENGGCVAALASEEMDFIHPIPEGAQQGNYLALFDPLDGSSNIDVNISVGTIFSILKRTGSDKDVNEAEFLQAGTQQVAAGYAIYGPATLLVMTLGDGVDAFTLDHDSGEFILTQEKMTIPADTKEFAINMSNQRFWEAPVQQYINELVAGKSGSRDKDFNMRWVASMVGDVHRILTRGGIFMYPYDLKDPSKAGKLRLMYEANPMSMLVEQAGGAATTGRQRILEVAPNQLHQRIPVILGSRNEVERVTGYHLS